MEEKEFLDKVESLLKEVPKNMELLFISKRSDGSLESHQKCSSIFLIHSIVAICQYNFEIKNKLIEMLKSNEIEFYMEINSKNQ